MVLGRDVQGYCPVDGKGDNAGLVMVAIRQARKGPCRAEELRLVEPNVIWSRSPPLLKYEIVPHWIGRQKRSRSEYAWAPQLQKEGGEQETLTRSLNLKRHSIFQMQDKRLGQIWTPQL